MALDEPDGCVLRIEPSPRLHNYGLGVSLPVVARDPLHVGAGRAALVRPSTFGDDVMIVDMVSK